ncbi:sirohydrochlorin chelatase [Metasolibacillus sp. FSL H7-0170]|uniref:sirohydrochlorin chelatase n=1 Tax=Metasolibacillus TaxID=2703677 RepID=UPI00079318DC|nr:sirohydrochlorin chelatase [Metasolibacillus fluoroglycofenilyticus]KYG89771.1 sirohydrochlorin ferrochelatase [[Bacillus] sp. KCTC 13219]
MQAILYVGHGTRVRQGVEEAIQFIKQIEHEVNVDIQEISFLELVEPDIVQGIKNCVERGATRIAIVPLLLLTAQHAKEDIPAEIEKAHSMYPHVHFTIGRPFGIHDKLVDTIYKRIMEQQKEISQEAEVLLIGRGSSDMAVVHNMSEISELVQRRFNFQSVSSCFLYGAGPSFQDALEMIKKRDAKQLFIVPYLLFSGLLSKGIEKNIKELQVDSSHVILCASLGYDENVRQVLLERVRELLNV